MHTSSPTWRKLLILGLVPLLLCSCSKRDSVAAAADAALVTALEQVKGKSDPWVAFLELGEKEKRILADNPPCYVSGLVGNEVCNPVPARKQVAETRARLLGQAIDAGNKRALVFLYANATEREYPALWSSSIPRLMAIAEKGVARPEDAMIFALAGDRIAEGKHTIRDTGKAVAYFAQAWAAGAPQAANSAAMLFLSINDRRNAYLWSLRCTTGCQRSDRYPESVQLDDLERRLSPAAIRQAQNLATDPSVVEIDISGG